MRSEGALGTYQSGEGFVLLRPSFEDGVDRPGVVFCHGAGGLGTNALRLAGVPSQSRINKSIVDTLSRIMIAPDMGGVTTWGNDTSNTRIGQAITYLKTQQGVSADPVHLVGVSMGGLAALNYAKANPAEVASVVAVLPVLDLAYAEANNIQSSAASIDTAYGGTYVDADQRADHNPSFYGPIAGSFRPTQVWYASDDEWCPLATFVAFDATPNTTSFNVGALGHDEDAIAAVDIPTVLRFIEAHD